MRRRDGVMCACLTFMVHTRNSLHQEKMMLLLTNNPDGTGAAALADAGCAPPRLTPLRAIATSRCTPSSHAMWPSVHSQPTPWSLKGLIRKIVMTRSRQRASPHGWNTIRPSRLLLSTEIYTACDRRCDVMLLFICDGV